MHRSSGKRCKIYIGDGNGRDSYIIAGKGGNLKQGSLKSTEPHTGHHPKKLQTVFNWPGFYFLRFFSEGNHGSLMRWWKRPCQFYYIRVFWLDSLPLGRFSQVPIHQQFETVLINHLWRLWQLNNKYNKVDSNILSVQESSQPFSIKKKKTLLKTFKRQRENFLALAYQTPVVKSLLKLRNKAALLVT